MNIRFSDVPVGGLFKPLKGSFLYRKTDKKHASRQVDKQSVHFSKMIPVDYCPVTDEEKTTLEKKYKDVTDFDLIH